MELDRLAIGDVSSLIAEGAFFLVVGTVGVTLAGFLLQHRVAVTAFITSMLRNTPAVPLRNTVAKRGRPRDLIAPSVIGTLIGGGLLFRGYLSLQRAEVLPSLVPGAIVGVGVLFAAVGASQVVRALSTNARRSREGEADPVLISEGPAVMGVSLLLVAAGLVLAGVALLSV